MQRACNKWSPKVAPMKASGETQPSEMGHSKQEVEIRNKDKLLLKWKISEYWIVGVRGCMENKSRKERWLEGMRVRWAKWGGAQKFGQEGKMSHHKEGKE